MDECKVSSSQRTHAASSSLGQNEKDDACKEELEGSRQEDQINQLLLDPSVVKRFDREAQSEHESQAEKNSEKEPPPHWLPWTLHVIREPGKDPPQHPDQSDNTTRTKAGEDPITATDKQSLDGPHKTGEEIDDVVVVPELSTYTTSSSFFPTESYLDLRERQHEAFCQSCLEQGRFIVASLKASNPINEESNEVNITAAENWYRQGLQVDPHHVDLWIALALLQANQQQEYSKAVTSLQTALHQHPHHSKAILYLEQVQKLLDQQQQQEQQKRHPEHVVGRRTHKSISALQDVQAERALETIVETHNAEASSIDRKPSSNKDHKKKKRKKKRTKKAKRRRYYSSSSNYSDDDSSISSTDSANDSQERLRRRDRHRRSNRTKRHSRRKHQRPRKESTKEKEEESQDHPQKAPNGESQEPENDRKKSHRHHDEDDRPRRRRDDSRRKRSRRYNRDDDEDSDSNRTGSTVDSLDLLPKRATKRRK